METTVSLSSDDWNEIFKTEPFAIGKTILKLKPLALGDITYVSLLITNITDKIAKCLPEDVGEKSILQVLPDILPSIVEMVQAEVPEALSIMSTLNKEDIKKLPANVVLDLAVKCIEINLGSLESLSKNFVALIQKSQALSQGMSNTTKPAIQKRVKR
jgi:hypothetical protein